MAKALQEDLLSVCFTPSLAKSEMEKKVERRRACSQDDRAKKVRLTRRESRDASKSRDRRRREAAGDGTTSRSVKVKLVTLRKRNHPDEAYVRRG